MTVERFIEFIVDLANDELYEKLNCDAKTYFTNGGCFEFAQVVKKYIPMSQIMINKENDHCAIAYRGNIYDATGIVRNKMDYSIARIDDIKYMEDRFGISELQYINNVTISDYLIDELKKCNILHTLQLEDEEEER